MFVAFALYNAAGVPLAGAVPTFVAYKDRAGANRSAPAIFDRGSGLYIFTPSASDLDVGVAYLIDGTSAARARYFSGTVGPGNFVGFALFDLATGAPKANAVPAFGAYKSSAGANLAQPSFVNLGSGLYAFEPSAGDLSTGVAYEINPGASVLPERLYGGTDPSYLQVAATYDVAKDLAAYLATQGLGLTLSSNLFSGREREEEVEGVFPRVVCLNYGGDEPEPFLGTGDSSYLAKVQVRVRGAPDAFDAGETLARQVLSALHLATISGYTYVKARDSMPNYFGSDTSGRDVWTFDVEAQWNGA